MDICPSCGIFLYDSYIRCAICTNPTRSFCVQCFSRGKEYGNHKSDHDYKVIRNDMPLFDPKWTGSEELKLLDAIQNRGFGNWSEIAKDVGTKNKSECEQHYIHCYIENPIDPLPKLEEPEFLSDKVYLTPSTSTSFSQDPPRPIPGSSSHAEMAGYMPARGDFMAEPDDFSEMDVQDITFNEDDDPIVTRFKSAVVDIYFENLQERHRKKELVAEYGLLSEKLNQEDSSRYEILGKDLTLAMKPFMSFLSPTEYYSFMEGFLLVQRLKNSIKLLGSCQAAGVTDLEMVEKYGVWKKERDEFNSRKSMTEESMALLKDENEFDTLARKQSKQLQILNDDSPSGYKGKGRPGASPLNIVTMPGFEKLTAKGRSLCAELRLTPSSFLNYQGILLKEQRKLGTLRLANARSVIKIDVNKTRKIFDLMIDEGLINKD